MGVLKLFLSPMDKFLELFFSLQKDELNAFERFIENHKDINTQHKLFLKELLNSKSISETKLEKKHNIRPQRIPYLKSELLNVAEKWIIHFVNSTQTNEIDRCIALLSFFESHQLEKNTSSIINKIEKIDPSQLFDAKEHLSLYRLGKQKDIYTKHRNNKTISINPIQYDKNLDVFYALEKIKIYCEEVNRKIMFRMEHNPHILFPYFESIRKYHPLLELYIEIYNLLNDNSIKENNVYQIIEKWKKISINQKFKIDNYTIFHYLVNIISRSIKKGMLELKKVLLDLIEFADHIDLLVENNKVNVDILLLSLYYAIDIENNTFVNQFYNKYKEEIRLSPKKFLMPYLDAIIFLHEQNFKKALDIVSKADISVYDPMKKIHVYMLDIRIRMEDSIKNNVNEYDIISFRLKSLQNFIQHDSISDINRNRAKTFCKQIAYMMKDKYPEIIPNDTPFYEWFLNLWIIKKS